MTFVATDSLSELVWSPRDGLSIKHTVGSGPEKKPYFIWGAGPSNMVLRPSHNIGNKVDLDNITEEREVIEPPVTFSVGKEGDDKTVFSTASKICGDVMQTSKLDSGCECSSEKSLHKGNQLVEHPSAKDAASGDSINAAWATELKCSSFSDQERGQSRNFSSESNNLNLDDGPVRSMPRDLVDVEMFESQEGGNAQFYPVSPVNCNPPSESHASRMCESNGALMLNQSSQCKEYLDAETALGEKSHNTMNVPSLNEKLEPTCQSEVLRLSKLVGDSSVGVQEGSKVEKEPLQLEGSDPAIKASPIRALALKGKGKYKALTDVDMQDGAVREDDDSYGSVESCNSSGFIPGGKKRILSFKQQLIVGTKRVKRLCQESPNSTASFTRYDSSFMNWMSTMIKGLPNSEDDTQPFFTLPLTHMVDESKYLKDHYFKPSNVGFQSIFRSLYQATSQFLDQGSLSPDNQIESCKKLEVLDKPCEPNSAIGSCEPPDTVMVKHVAGSSESPKQGMEGDKESPSVHLKISKGNFSTFSHGCNANIFDLHLINSSGQESAAEKAGSSHATFVKLKSDRSGGNGVGLPSEEKTARDNMNRSDPLSSLWVTRLGSEACSHTKPPINFKLNASGAPEANIDQKFIHNSQSHVNLLQDLNIVEYLEHSSEEPSSSNCKKSHDSSLVFEANTSVESVELQKAVNPIIPSQNLKGSETMSSVLDKKLDAFKNILASDIAKKETFHSVTCIFCGLMGHGLRACPQVTKTELEGLLTKITGNVGVEVSPCLCIICFQLNHWAVACPNVSLNKPNQLERCASQLDYCNSSQMKHVSETGKNLDPLDDTSQRIQSGKGKTSCEGSFKLPSISSFPDVNMEMNATTTSVGRVSTSILDKLTSSSHRETARRPPRLSRRCLSLPDMHEGIFKAVKGLRLSRLDILKWIASPVPISHLNGYYLRLRLGKSEEGFGSTGYYVACITGFEGHELPETFKNPMPVMVRGTKCLVESHNISNQDFLEVELMAWWSSILRDGGKVPSEDDLRLKFEERKILGL